MSKNDSSTMVLVTGGRSSFDEEIFGAIAIITITGVSFFQRYQYMISLGCNKYNII